MAPCCPLTAHPAVLVDELTALTPGRLGRRARRAVYAIAPLPELGFILQGTAFGAVVGTAVAYRAKKRFQGPVDRDKIIARCTLTIGGLFALGVLVEAGLRGVS